MGYSPNIFHHLVNSPKKSSPNDKFSNSPIEQLVNSTIFYSTGANSTRVSSPIQTVCLKAPPGGLRSGALAPRSQGVWGLAPILGQLSFRPIQTTSSGGCKNCRWVDYLVNLHLFKQIFVELHAWSVVSLLNRHSVNCLSVEFDLVNFTLLRRLSLA